MGDAAGHFSEGREALDLDEAGSRHGEVAVGGSPADITEASDFLYCQALRILVEEVLYLE